MNERYKKIGGSSPLLAITNAQASALEKSLGAQGLDARVYVGMKHWHPYIREVIPTIVNDGLKHVVALALAPHYSQISMGGYRQALDQAATEKVQVASHPEGSGRARLGYARPVSRWLRCRASSARTTFHFRGLPRGSDEAVAERSSRRNNLSGSPWS